LKTIAVPIFYESLPIVELSFVARSINTTTSSTLELTTLKHTKTKVAHPQTNGICERFHKTILQEFYQVTFRKKIYKAMDDLQTDLDQWMIEYNERRTHQGKMCNGRTPLETFIDGIKIWRQKDLGLNLN
jgi:hypothetical protein